MIGPLGVSLLFLPVSDGPRSHLHAISMCKAHAQIISPHSLIDQSQFAIMDVRHCYQFSILKCLIRDQV